MGNAGEKETFFIRSGAGLSAIIVVSVDCVDCVDATDDTERVRMRVGVFSSLPSSKEQDEKAGESPSAVEGNDVDENTESTEERALDVDDIEDDRLPDIGASLSMGISAYVRYSSVF